MRFILFIDAPSQNVYDKWHWSKKYKYRNECFMIVKEALGNYEYQSEPPHIFHFERHSKRLIDPLNCYSSLKPIMDAFTEYGVIEDDSSKFISYIQCKQMKLRKGEKPHIVLDIL